MIYKQNLMIGWSEVFYDWNTCIYFVYLPKCGREIIQSNGSIKEEQIGSNFSST